MRYYSITTDNSQDIEAWWLQELCSASEAENPPQAQERRVCFCKAPKHMPESFWENFIFSYESKFNLHVQKTLKIAGAILARCFSSIMWRRSLSSVVAGSWVGVQYCIAESATFIHTPENGLGAIRGTSQVRVAKDYRYAQHESFWCHFQQGNHPKHVSRYPMAFPRHLHSAGMSVMRWSSCSPDMNIQNVWDDFVRRIRISLLAEPNVDILTDKTPREWYATDPAYIRHLYESIPRCIDALFKA